MNIEYPPMMNGSDSSNIAALRSYLYRLADALEFRFGENVTDPKTEHGGRPTAGMRKVYSSSGTGLTVNGFVPLTEEAATASVFICVLGTDGDIGTSYVPVFMFRRGDVVKGSYVNRYSSGNVFFSLRFLISGARLTVKQAIFTNIDNPDDSGTLPGGAGTSAEGYTIREVYALVL